MLEIHQKMLIKLYNEGLPVSLEEIEREYQEFEDGENNASDNK